MATIKKPQVAPVTNNTGAHVENCHVEIVNKTAANKYTRAAVEALAKAVEANARAISDIAAALKGGNITTGPAMLFDNLRGSD